MTDRRITYTGQVPLVDDFLEPQRNQMVALGTFMRMLMGSEPIVEGLVITQTQPATLAVTVTAGSIYGGSVVDATPYGELPAITNQTVIKQGILHEAVTLAVTPGTVAGQSRNYLVQAAVVVRDEGSTVLPYFNADNPNIAWIGPGNSGAPQPTRRVEACVVSLKAGAPATTGSQVTPTPDAGYIALGTVTVASLSGSVPASNISNNAAVPRFAATLQQLRPATPTIVSFTTVGAQTWTVPAGVRRVRARVWGGGGGGGAALTSNSLGSGGGAGGYGERTIEVTPGQQISVTVGAGGAGGLVGAAGTVGGTGGTSSFGTFVSATGGAGGQAGTSIPGAGGSGTGGDVNVQGGHGYGGIPITGTGLGGQGGSAAGGGGQGANHSMSANSGNAGIAPGGGGGGCGANNGNSGLGGAGARGSVVIEY